MSTLSAFLAENVLTVEHIKFPASARFLDEKKKLMLRKIKTISATEDEALRKACATQVLILGKKSQYQRETDYNMYLGKLAVACTVFPDLNNAELQNSYHAMGGEALLKATLTPGEYADYVSKIQEVCGFDATLQDEGDDGEANICTIAFTNFTFFPMIFSLCLEKSRRLLLRHSM